MIPAFLLRLYSTMGQVESAIQDLESDLPPQLETFDLKGVAEKIKAGDCKRILVMTGAGVSVSAGIPDFRSPQSGLFAKIRARYPDDEMLSRRPECVFDLAYFQDVNEAPFYEVSQEIMSEGYKPTPTHHFIKLLDDKGLLVRCYTQNIDSLETAAGLSSEKVIAAHGNFDGARCLKAGKEVPIAEFKEAVRKGDAEGGWRDLNKKYGDLVKPDVVFYGEALPRRFFSSLGKDTAEADLLIVMGTALKVGPFNRLVGQVPFNCVRLLVNRDPAGLARPDNTDDDTMSLPQGFVFNDDKNVRDVFHQGDCDAGVWELARLLEYRPPSRLMRYLLV